LDAINSGKKCGVVLVDISGAFEYCDPDEIVSDLEAAGVRGPALDCYMELD